MKTTILLVMSAACGGGISPKESPAVPDGPYAAAVNVTSTAPAACGNVGILQQRLTFAKGALVSPYPGLVTCTTAISGLAMKIECASPSFQSRARIEAQFSADMREIQGAGSAQFAEIGGCTAAAFYFDARAGGDFP